MRVFKTKWFEKWSKKEKLNNKLLKNAIDEIDKGLVDADLGKAVFKKRIATTGQGKSSGYRTIITYKVEDKAFFIYGFSKNKKSNISKNELKALQILAENLLGHDALKLKELILKHELFEICIGEVIEND